MNEDIGDLIVQLSDYCGENQKSLSDLSNLILNMLTVEISHGIRRIRTSSDLQKIIRRLQFSGDFLNPPSRKDMLEILMFTSELPSLSKILFGEDGANYTADNYKKTL